MILNCRGILLDLSTPKVMGILNVTPDSFFDGGKYTTQGNMIHQIETMIEDGVDIIDIGGMSSRPGAAIIAPSEELDRVLPAVDYIAKHHPTQLMSIDTLHSETARRCVEHGVHIINDISGGTHDIHIVEVAIDWDCPYVMMHIQGTPADMQKDPVYDDVVLDVLSDFAERVRAYRDLGLKDIVIDPGFGFGKTVEHNYALTSQLSTLRILDCPILVGVSRKSMLYRPLKITSQDALNATTALHMVLLQNGASILRVHDVREAKECIKIFGLINR